MVKPIQEKQKCPFCNKGEIVVMTIPEHYDMTTSRISSGSKKIPRFHEERIDVHEKCPNCGKTKKEIEKALQTGETKQLTHEERLKKIRDSGLPTKIEG